jgi:high-affinity K+ transport system ATPase subunit B
MAGLINFRQVIKAWREGVASVDESAIKGESAPVIRLDDAQVNR